MAIFHYRSQKLRFYLQYRWILYLFYMCIVISVFGCIINYLHISVNHKDLFYRTSINSINHKDLFYRTLINSKQSNITQYHCFHDYNSSDLNLLMAPILTLFTTVKDREVRKEIHRRTITNWAALKPHVIPVLFVPVTENSSEWRHLASEKGWIVKDLQKHQLRQNVPILRGMYMDIQANISTPFMAFANADILFDCSIIKTLQFLYKTLHNIENSTVLIVGRRRNLKSDPKLLGQGDNFTTLADAGNNSSLYKQHAEDYFIVSRKGLYWDKIPDFVVGRIGYDNWLVAMARNWKASVIDASETVLAIHQTGKDGKKSGRTTNKGQTYMNYNVVKKFNYRRGYISCAPLVLNCLRNVTLTGFQICNRTNFPSHC